ncbi:glycosyltransferase family 4 protein [Virgibacillus siamensis]|uniref:glycosyltransferase family 4 protein n=1 Tax=Virgibacillus siamensis TaxID=480071 RepID=UPI00098472E4|nr:glycosyltransferase family 4 protein [Virgibacillus siamensis]
MKKVLFVATVVKKHIMQFHIPYLKWFKENGYETFVCARNDYEDMEKCNIPYCDYYYDLPFDRSPFKLNNVRAFKQLKEIIYSNKFDIIHCHTPVGGVLGRLAARKVRNQQNTQVIYTAHGFHFFKGAPLKNWIIYYNVEKLLMRWTDAIITMNDEDFNNAKKMAIKSSTLTYNIHGVGIDINEFSPQTRKVKYDLRKSYGYDESDVILIYVGELNKRKNQTMLIKVMNILKMKIPNIKLLLIGSGIMEEELKNIVYNLKLQGVVDFLGYRKDIPQLMKISDLSVSSSFHEGLPVNIMEAMATGLPLVVTNARGNRDLVKNQYNGYVVQNNVEQLSVAISKIVNSEDLKYEFGKNSLKLINDYSLENVLREMKKIYWNHSS